MWIKPETAPDSRKFIAVPPAMAKELGRKCTVVFGGRTARARVIAAKELEFYENSAFDDPITVRLSGRLRDCLLLPETLCYRAKTEKNKLIIGTVIGLLLGGAHHAADGQQPALEPAVSG